MSVPKTGVLPITPWANCGCKFNSFFQYCKHFFYFFNFNNTLLQKIAQYELIPKKVIYKLVNSPHIFLHLKMTNTTYTKWNNITGWLVFLIALITYTLTLEPTVSAWDCGEYISTSVKLSVGHPPGAPLFQMLGAFFAMFTSDPANIASMVNFMSALASAFTILFMFWTITNLARKMTSKEEQLSLPSVIAILGSGVVGGLAYTFSDSFWFSAVEGEVYAMSSFLMAILFWLGLKWENEMHLPRGNKWLLLISFVVGLSFGVHILSLLVIPAIVMLYFFKTYHTINLKTTAIASVISVLILAFIFKFLNFSPQYFFHKQQVSCH